MQHPNLDRETDGRDATRRSRASKPHHVDIVVGQRMRIRRTELGLSQTGLGEKVGLTFQQIQKYEKGSNRVSSSTLFEIAGVLDVPIDFFFETCRGGQRADGARADHLVSARLAFLETSEGGRLVDVFQRLRKADRLHVLALISALAQSWSGEATDEEPA